METNFNEVIKIEGKESGPTSIILVGVHGDEPCGVEAIGRILPTLNIEKGLVYIAYGNPKAIEQKVRYTQKNLNRLFKPESELTETEKNTYEYKRVVFLKDYLDKADVLLDVHASNTPQSKPFIICEPNAKDITSFLPIDLLVSGFDELQPGGTDYYMNTKGKIGICIECGDFKDPVSTDIAEECIKDFLIVCGHVNGGKKPTKQDHIKLDLLYKSKTNSFILSKEFEDFESVTAGQIIGRDSGEEVKTDKDRIILFAHSREQAGIDAFFLGTKNN